MIVGYVYDISGTLIDQIFDLINFECLRQLVGYDSASFKIQEYDKTTYHLFNRVKIYEVIDGEEKLYIDGFISARKPTLDSTTIYLRSYEWIFEKILIDDNKTYNGTLDSIINDVVTEFNARFNRGLTYDCGIATVRGGSFTAGTRIKDVLDKIASSGYEYKVIDGVLIFKEELGNDYTQDPIDPIYLNTDYLDFDGSNDYVKSDDVFYQSSETFSIYGNVTEDNGAFVFAGTMADGVGQTANIRLGNPNLTQVDDFEIQIDFTYDGDVLGTTNRWSGLVGDATDFSLGFYQSDRKVRLVSKPTYSSYIGPTLTVGQRYIYNVKYDGISKKAYLYENGVLLNVGGTTMSTTFTLNSFNIGDHGSEYGSPASNAKKIYDCKLWNRQLSDAERADSINGVTIWTGLMKWANGKHFLQNNTALTHSIDLVNSRDRLLPCDNIVVAFDFAIDQDGYASTASLGLWCLPFLTCHVRETDNQVQFRYDNSGAVIATTTYVTLGSGDRGRHRCICCIFRDGNTTRLWCQVDGGTIAVGSSTKVPYSGKGISTATAVYLGYGMSYGNVRMKNFDIYKFNTLDNTSHGINLDDVERLSKRQSPIYTADLQKFLAYPMQEGTGTVLTDSSGNGRDATLYNGTAWAEDTTAPFVVEVPQEFDDPIILKMDARDASDRNIEDVEIIVDGDQIINAPYEKATGFSTDSGSITEYGRLEGNITGTGDIAKEKARILSEQSIEVIQAEISALFDDFHSLDVGDKVKVYIYYGENMDNIDGTSRIIKKEYVGGKAKIQLSENKVKSKTILETIEEQQAKIKQIENEL